MRNSKNVRTFRPSLETLEDRSLPSTSPVSLLGGGFSNLPVSRQATSPALKADIGTPQAVTGSWSTVPFDTEKFVTSCAAAPFSRPIGNGQWQLGTVHLTASEKANLRTLLGMMQNDPNMQRIRWAAYALATAQHETGYSWAPVKENITPAQAVQKYFNNTALATSLGNLTADDAKKYIGRGYVQITGRGNYARMQARLRQEPDFKTINLLDDPDLATKPDVAYRILSIGMREGYFGASVAHGYWTLRDFLWDYKTDYFGARKIINGTDHAAELSGNAWRMDAMLRDSQFATFRYTDLGMRVASVPSWSEVVLSRSPLFNIPAGANVALSGKFSGQLLGPAESNWTVAAGLSASLQREDGVAVSPLGGMILDGGHPIQTSSMAERLLVYPQGGNWRVVVTGGTLSLPAWVAQSKLELAITIG